MARFAVILPAAGKSERFKTHQQKKKPFIDLKGRPVWVRTAEQFCNRADVIQTIIAVSPEDMEFFKEKFRPNLAFMNVDIVEGGASRADSVFNALKAVRDDAEYVAVHDAARPLIVGAWIDKVFSEAVGHGAAILGTPITSTVKLARVNSKAAAVIDKTIPRDSLWQAQTPQVFRKDLLTKAYAMRGTLEPTDEAQLAENAGIPVSIVEGSPLNLKITTFDDFKMAEALLAILPAEKKLNALHPFADEDPKMWR